MDCCREFSAVDGVSMLSSLHGSGLRFVAEQGIARIAKKPYPIKFVLHSMDGPCHDAAIELKRTTGAGGHYVNSKFNWSTKLFESIAKEDCSLDSVNQYYRIVENVDPHTQPSKDLCERLGFAMQPVLGHPGVSRAPANPSTTAAAALAHFLDRTRLAREANWNFGMD